jgi:hypothetical protein
MGGAKLTFQNIVDHYTQILGRGHQFLELWEAVQVLVIISVHDLLLHAVVKIDQVTDHPSGWIDLASHRHG